MRSMLYALPLVELFLSKDSDIKPHYFFPNIPYNLRWENLIFSQRISFSWKFSYLSLPFCLKIY